MPTFPASDARTSTGDEVAIDELTGIFYASFDNRMMRKPALGQLRSLFDAAAQIARLSGDDLDLMTVDEFIIPREKMLTDGSLTDFYEYEVEQNTSIRGSTAVRSSIYTKRGFLNGASYDGGGHKFIMLCKRKSKWIIQSVLWEDK